MNVFGRRLAGAQKVGSATSSVLYRFDLSSDTIEIGDLKG